MPTPITLNYISKYFKAVSREEYVEEMTTVLREAFAQDPGLLYRTARVCELAQFFPDLELENVDEVTRYYLPKDIEDIVPDDFVGDDCLVADHLVRTVKGDYFYVTLKDWEPKAVEVVNEEDLWLGK